MEPTSYALVKHACEKLTDLELAAINNIAQWGEDPRGVIGYEKVSHLFTESGGTKMHAEYLDALAAVTIERLIPARK